MYYKKCIDENGSVFTDEMFQWMVLFITIYYYTHIYIQSVCIDMQIKKIHSSLPGTSTMYIVSLFGSTSFSLEGFIYYGCCDYAKLK